MPPRRPKSLVSRKLLVAALGVATINYVGSAACGGAVDGEGEGRQENNPPTSGNLPSPPPRGDAQPPPLPPPTSGNLPAPPPPDGGEDADAGDEGDADADVDGAVR